MLDEKETGDSQCCTKLELLIPKAQGRGRSPAPLRLRSGLRLLALAVNVEYMSSGGIAARCMLF